MNTQEIKFAVKKQELLVLKRRLYSTLLGFSNDELTEDDVDIMVALSKDSQIQSYLQKMLSEENTIIG